MSALSNISLANAFLAPASARAARAISSAVAGFDAGRSSAARNEPVSPVKPAGREQAQVRGRHLRLVGEDAPTRQQASRTDTDEPQRLRGGGGGPRDSIAFTAQLLGQASSPLPNRALAGYGQDLGLRKDSAQIGSNIYRLAGAEPDLLSQAPTFLSLAV